ncbi:acyltransferase [Aneurinibacillus sp. REN35]|uniref:acyltransferase n=1 Tax=Aneurinibacillus sp. REN35 TaxID=3237286 RepID=UPI003528B8A5
MKYIKEGNFLRGMAIIGVLLIHTTTYFSMIHELNLILIVNVTMNVLVHFAVPLFVFISGMVLANRYYKEYSLKSFYWKRFKSIIPAYFIFSILYIWFNNQDLIFDFKQLLKMIFWANASYHLWYFALIVQLYIIYPFVIKLYIFAEKRNEVTAFVLTAFFIQLILNLIYILLVLNVPSVIQMANYIQVFSYLFYFSTGIYIACNFDNFKKIITSINGSRLSIIFVSFTIIMAALFLYGLSKNPFFESVPYLFLVIPRMLEPFYYIITFIFIFKIKSSIHTTLIKVIESLGAYSFGIYLIHPLIISITVQKLQLINVYSNQWIFYPIVLFMALVGSYLFVYIISFFPYSHYYIGINKRNVISRRN